MMIGRSSRNFGTAGSVRYVWGSHIRRTATTRSPPRPRLLRHLFQDLPQHTRRAHALREGKPQCSATLLQLQALGIAADAAPFAVGRAEELGGIEPAGLGVVAVHVRENVGLGRDQLGG